MKANELTNPDLLQHEEIEALLPELDGIIAWAKQVQDYALTQALAGKKYKGYKVVEGRANRTLTDETEAVKRLKAEGYSEAVLYERKLLGITSLEKLVGKNTYNNVLKDLVFIPQGKPALVPESDKRKEFTPASSAASDFGDTDDGSEF